MRYTHILWDFNGTLLDDVKTGIDSVNELLAARRLKTIPNRAYYQEVFGFPIRSYYERLGFDFEKEPYESLAVEWVDLYNAYSKSAPLTPGAKETLQALQSLHLPQIILSATEKTMLMRQLEDLGIMGYFEEVLGLDNIYAGSKTHLGVAWKARVLPQKALLIGDTTHDFETACAMGIDCILFDGGHMNKQTLMKCGCPVIEHLQEILPYIERT